MILTFCRCRLNFSLLYSILMRFLVFLQGFNLEVEKFSNTVLEQSFGNFLKNSVFFLENKNSEDFFFYQIFDFYSLSFGITYGTLLFIIGLFGGLWNSSGNVLIFMLCVELMLLGIGFNFILFSVFLFNPQGQLYAMFLLTIAASESAIGLGLLISANSLKKKVFFHSLNEIRG